MPLTIKSIVKALVALVALLLVLAAMAYAWLRYEFSRADVGDPLSWWQQVPVDSLATEDARQAPFLQQYPN